MNLTLFRPLFQARFRRTNAAVALIAIALAGCATLQGPLDFPDPATAQSVKVQLSDHSSIGFSDPNRAQRIAAYLNRFQDGWRSALLSHPTPRYEVAISYADGTELSYSVGANSISRADQGARTRALSEEELRELDRKVLGENPYERFQAIALD